MARWIVAGLVALNVLLGVGVYLRMGGETAAYGQIGGGKSYTTVSGMSGGDTMVYVLETTTGRLVALRTSILDRKVTLVAGRNVKADFDRIK